MARIIGLALVASIGLALGCGDGPTNPPAPVASVTLDRTAVTLAEGDTTRLVATPRDASGRPLTGRPVSWTSADPAVASVTALGVVTAHRAATTTVTASAEGRTATATVAVSAPLAYELIHSGWPDYPLREWRLFQVGLDGGQSTPLLPADVLPDFGFVQAAPSPDGRRIAFTGYRYNPDAAFIFVAHADGSGLQQLTTGGSEVQPTWSPDGTRIAYVVRPRGQPGDIWVMNADGSDPVNLTGGVNEADQNAPDWSPDLPGGSRIAFGEGDAYRSSLWTMRADGTDRRRVTSGDQWWDDEPAWSPDGTRIVFQREGPGTQGADIWVVDATGANAAPLVQVPQGQVFPDWSPDGRLIAFNSAHAEDPQDWFVVYSVRSDGSGLTRRTFDPWMSTRAVWRVLPSGAPGSAQGRRPGNRHLRGG